MAGASDKARYYLERCVPELQEYERKGIFSRQEITAITSKRSEFEHILNGRGAKASDYARYAAYEMNLDGLRKKRSKRLGVKITTFSGQRNIFLILDRATKRFPGDTSLWLQYISFCRREGSSKKLAKILTSALRLKPREYGLWVLAAKHYAEDSGDMPAARTYMQRGLRFCKEEKRLWMEYFRLEMSYLAKVAARRRLLGLDAERTQDDTGGSALDQDMLTLPPVTMEEFDVTARKGTEEMDAAMLKRIASVPAFTGSIPIAIFDEAMVVFGGRQNIAEEFFDATTAFTDMTASNNILNHIVDYMFAAQQDSAGATICKARLCLWNIDTDTAAFPSALGDSLATISDAVHNLSTTEQNLLAERTIVFLVPLLRNAETMDEDIIKVITTSIRRYVKSSTLTMNELQPSGIAAFERFVEQLRKRGGDQDVEILEQVVQPG